MHLMDILARRQEPAAGLYLSLTRRCPLSCAHCSTNSTLSSEEYPDRVFLDLIDTFTAEDRPAILVLTGGEPLIRPQLVLELTERAHRVGTRVVLASGMFFAKQRKVPAAIARAIAAVDHFTVSLDVFHEQQVSRQDVFRVMHDLVDRGKDVSFHLIGMDADDPYLAEVSQDIRTSFEDRVPALAGVVNPVGRAKTWMEPLGAETVDVEPMPCDLSAWPVVVYDGTVIGCCNQTVVDGPAPPHLRLGHTGVDDWPTIHQRCLTSPTLRAIRIYGPEYVAATYGSGRVSCDGYCSTCYRLSDDPEIAVRLEPVMARPAMDIIENHVAALQQAQFLARHDPTGHTNLAWLGHPSQSGPGLDDAE
jgi:organic radical activating enzyme